MIIRKREFHFSEDQKAELSGLFPKYQDVRQIERLARVIEKVLCPNYFYIKELMARGEKTIRAAKKASKAIDILKDIKSKNNPYIDDAIIDTEFESAISNPFPFSDESLLRISTQNHDHFIPQSF